MLLPGSATRIKPRRMCRIHVSGNLFVLDSDKGGALRRHRPAPRQSREPAASIPCRERRFPDPERSLGRASASTPVAQPSRSGLLVSGRPLCLSRCGELRSLGGTGTSEVERRSGIETIPGIGRRSRTFGISSSIPSRRCGTGPGQDGTAPRVQGWTRHIQPGPAKVPVPSGKRTRFLTGFPRPEGRQDCTECPRAPAAVSEGPTRSECW